jgi:hypothetical protein
MTEDQQVRALTIKMCEAAKGSSPSVLMRAFGRMTAVLAYALDIPVDEMLQAIIDEATETELDDNDQRTHLTH